MKELNISYRLGCLHCSLSDKELNEYIQEKKRSTVHLPLKHAVSHVGLQEDNTWVLGPDICISSAGRLIPLESSKYVWIGDIYKGAGVAAVRDQCKISLPLSTHPLSSLVTYLETMGQHNFFPMIMTIAGRLHMIIIISSLMVTYSAYTILCIHRDCASSAL